MHSLGVMAGTRPSGWLARTTIAGFVGLGVATVVLVGVSALAGTIGGLYRGSNLIADWMFELTENPVVELGRGSLFASLGVHLAVGMFWAVLYALVFEPRLQQYPPWQSGVIFSMLPFFLSVALFLPLTGGGLFGSELGAGPLPLIGNLVLHLIYGATLGAVYGAGADRVDVENDTQVEALRQTETMGRAETSAARGILIGVIGGGLLGALVGALFPASSIERLIGSWTVAMGVGGALAGGAVGALIGSMAGLTDPTAVAVEGPTTRTGEPIAAALIPLGVILVVAALIVSIGSLLLTVGDIHHYGTDQGYGQAIIAGLAILTVVTIVATVIDRTGRGRPKDDH